MDIIGIICLIFIALWFADEIKTHKWRGVIFCGVVIVTVLINAFKKELGLEGLRLILAIFGFPLLVTLIALQFPEVRDKKRKKEMKRSKDDENKGYSKSKNEHPKKLYSEAKNEHLKTNGNQRL